MAARQKYITAELFVCVSAAAGRSWAGVAELQPAGAWGALVPSPSGELVSASSLTQAQRSQQSPSRELVVATPGLQNQIGEYNCFLNVIIQSLWNCRHFRAPFKAASAAFCSAQVPLCLLLRLINGIAMANRSRVI